jgi:uncharacterized protein
VNIDFVYTVDVSVVGDSTKLYTRLMTLSRRQFVTLAGAGATSSIVVAAVKHLYANAAEGRSVKGKGYGSLVKDPKGILDLPPGFRYVILSKEGGKMSDGSIVPGHHDGMAAFAGPNGATILIRNHELKLDSPTKVVAPAAKLYDPSCRGGTTTLIVGRDRKLVRDYVSLAGTSTNCAGGKTLWNSWISCEETVSMPTEAGDKASVTKPHGYNFEVPINAKGPVTPKPLVAMGRFRHEAIEMDPRTGIVYQTEDREDGLFYRFIPKQSGNLAAGGVLEALKISSQPKVNTAAGFPVGKPVAVEWVRIEDVDPKGDTVRKEGLAKGAAQFTRGEGICYTNGEFYFTCTNGGSVPNGQIWRYTPGKTALAGGTIELFIEPNDTSILDLPDNITIAPNRDLMVCEDGAGEQRLIGITPKGQLYTFARNALSPANEFAGICFSPDGQTMFVNIYKPGMTLAVWGPWVNA